MIIPYRERREGRSPGCAHDLPLLERDLNGVYLASLTKSERKKRAINKTPFSPPSPITHVRVHGDMLPVRRAAPSHSPSGLFMHTHTHLP